jgi:hypothetical protein
VLCQGNHPSWARECLVQAKHAESAKLAYINWPAHYQASSSSSFVRKAQPENPQGTPQASQTNQASQDEPIITAVIDHPLEDWQQPWVEVSHKRTPSPQSPRSTSAPLAKRLWRRPVRITKASKNIIDICTFAAT